MSDLRTKIADALCVFLADYDTGHVHLTEGVDRLLAIPDVAIVELPTQARITKTRDGEGWRRARCGKGDMQSSLVVDDRNGRVCVLDTWIPVAKIPNLIAALLAAADAAEAEQ